MYQNLSFRAETEGAKATEGVVEKSRRCFLCHADTRRSPNLTVLCFAGAIRRQLQSPRRNPLNQRSSPGILGISPLALSPLRQAQGPAWSVEMTEIGGRAVAEPNTFTPSAFSTRRESFSCGRSGLRALLLIAACWIR